MNLGKYCWEQGRKHKNKLEEVIENYTPINEYNLFVKKEAHNYLRRKIIFFSQQ